MDKQISFDEGGSTLKRRNVVANSGFARRLISWGVVKNETQANLLLLTLVVVGLVITVLNIRSVYLTANPPSDGTTLETP